MIDRTLTRRRIISIVSTGAVVGLAGCGVLQEEGPEETNDGETANDEDSEMDEDDGMNGNDTPNGEEGDDVADNDVNENEPSNEDDDVEIQEVEGYGRGADEESNEENA